MPDGARSGQLNTKRTHIYVYFEELKYLQEPVWRKRLEFCHDKWILKHDMASAHDALGVPKIHYKIDHVVYALILFL